MRELKRQNGFIKVIVKDDPGAGYYINGAGTVTPEGPFGEYGYVHFQEGPIKEAGVNGCHNEDLLAVVVDRLEGFQSGEFACEKNAVALALINLALDQLRIRTKKREARGVEGTSNQ